MASSCRDISAFLPQKKRTKRIASAQFTLSGLKLLQQCHICGRKLEMHAEPLCQPLKAGLTEEADVCGVEYIMPTRKCLLAVDTLGHQRQPRALRDPSDQ